MDKSVKARLLEAFPSILTVEMTVKEMEKVVRRQMKGVKVRVGMLRDGYRDPHMNQEVAAMEKAIWWLTLVAYCALC